MTQTHQTFMSLNLHIPEIFEKFTMQAFFYLSSLASALERVFVLTDFELVLGIWAVDFSAPAYTGT